jgi:hypothetical protein
LDSAAEIIQALNAIAVARKKLQDLGVIRSQKFQSDYGEWLASQVLELPLATSRVQPHWDLAKGARRVQVRTHSRAETNRAKRTVLKADRMDFSELAILVLDSDYRLVDFFLIARPTIESRFSLSLAKRVVYWRQLADCSIRRVPRKLGAFLSVDSQLVVG